MIDIRALRTNAGLSQKELAAATGLNQSQISRIESGARTLTIDELERIARAIDKRPSELFSEAESTAA